MKSECEFHDYINCDDFNEEYCKKFDFYENYEKDSGKVYASGEFIKDFGKGPKKYVYMLLNHKYVVAREILEEDEILDLEKYCDCPSCRLPNYIPLFWSYSHIRTVKDFVDVDDLVKTRNNKELKKLNTNTTTKWMTMYVYMYVFYTLILVYVKFI